MVRKLVVVAALLMGVVGGIGASGIGTGGIEAASPPEGLLVQDDGGGTGSGYCQITHLWISGAGFVHIVSCSTGGGATEWQAGG